VTASAQVLLAGGAGPQAGFVPWTVQGRGAAGTAVGATLAFNPDGTVSGNVTGTNQSVPGSPFWFNPPVAGIGANFWIQRTVTATQGAGLTYDDGAGWLQLNATRQWGESTSTGAAAIDGVTLTIKIAADAAGSNVVFTSTGNVVNRVHV
jgi:hypothetical protein